jgi:hypothetical protein
MGNLAVNIPDEIEEAFRAAVFQKKGMKRGNISDALEEAILDWIRKANTK